MENTDLLLIVILAMVSCLPSLTSAILPPSDSGFNFVHHDHPATVALLHAVNKKCPDITRVYNLSETSVEGRELVVIEITSDPGKHMPKKPEFKYVGNMHGNEVVGKEMLLRLIVYLCDEFLNGDKLVTFLVRNTRMHIMPTMNPDGWHKASEEFKAKRSVDWLNGRANANGVDLNRNFPDLDKIMFENEREEPENNNHLETLQEAFELCDDLQPETRAVMRWLSVVDFVLSANLHGGDLVANYPYDTGRPDEVIRYANTPDDATFIELALSYSYFHGKMSDPDRKLCDPRDRFKDGITNGDAWYPVSRGMQDYNYLETNCFELTLELGCEKFPPESKLQGFWQDNVWALLNFMLQTHMGIKGIVSSTGGQPIANAVIQVTNISRNEVIMHDILSVSDGDYYRLLRDGMYKVTVSARGHHSVTKCVTVKNQNYVGARRLVTAKEVNFVLTPVAEARPDGRADMYYCHLLRQSAEYARGKAGDVLQDEQEIKEFHHIEQQLLEKVLSHADPGIKTPLKPKLSASYMLRILMTKLTNRSTDERAKLLNRVLSGL